MLKKILYVFSFLIQITLISGIFILKDLYTKRMGVMRHILFTNGVWEENYPISTIKTIVTVSFLVLILICIVFTIKAVRGRKQFYSLQTLILSFFSVLLASATVWVINFSSVEVAKTHYYDCLFLFVVTIIQFITFFVYFMFRNKVKGTGIRV